MVLLIDIGNSRIKWATLARRKRSAHHSAPRPEPSEWHAYAVETWGGGEEQKIRPKKVVVVNVAGNALAAAVTEWCLEHWQLTPAFVTPEDAAFGVTNGYHLPERLGADRWTALLAARKRWRTPVCLVDAGTAITIDVLAADGAHLGGLIMPGIELMRRSLLERSEGIRLGAESPSRGDINLLARDTRDGIDGGTLYAAVAAIDRVTHDVDTELAGAVTRVITGGDAERLLPLLSGAYHHAPGLVLDGLAIIAEGS